MPLAGSRQCMASEPSHAPAASHPPHAAASFLGPSAGGRGAQGGAAGARARPPLRQPSQVAEGAQQRECYFRVRVCWSRSGLARRAGCLAAMPCTCRVAVALPPLRRLQGQLPYNDAGQLWGPRPVVYECCPDQFGCSHGDECPQARPCGSCDWGPARRLAALLVLLMLGGLPSLPARPPETAVS